MGQQIVKLKKRQFLASIEYINAILEPIPTNEAQKTIQILKALAGQSDNLYKNRAFQIVSISK